MTSDGAESDNIGSDEHIRVNDDLEPRWTREERENSMPTARPMIHHVFENTLSEIFYDTLENELKQDTHARV